MVDDTKAGVPTKQKVNNAIGIAVQDGIIALATYFGGPLGAIIATGLTESDLIWGEDGNLATFLATPREIYDLYAYFPDDYVIF